jgi:hypothetical protein
LVYLSSSQGSPELRPTTAVPPSGDLAIEA